MICGKQGDLYISFNKQQSTFSKQMYVGRDHHLLHLFLEQFFNTDDFFLHKKG